MKTLYLIRHAKSSWEDPFQNDLNRPLSSRGKRDAPQMGKKLKEKKIHPDLMISSPAKRAFSTCKIIAEMIGYNRENIQTDQKLYHPDEDQILSFIQKLNDKYEEVMIFGHNPGLTDFVNRLGGNVAEIENIPTCGVVAFKLPIDSWKEVKWKKGKLDFFDFPKKE